MWKEFKEFAVKGSVIDMAVGIIIGVAFNGIVKSLVDDVIMPPIGLLLRNIDFSELYALLKPGNPGGPYETIAAAKKAGAVTINYGLFLNTVVSFIITAFAVFLLIRQIKRLQRPSEKAVEEPTVKECPYCLSNIPLHATRCPQCTSTLDS